MEKSIAYNPEESVINRTCSGGKYYSDNCKIGCFSPGFFREMDSANQRPDCSFLLADLHRLPRKLERVLVLVLNELLILHFLPLFQERPSGTTWQ